MQFSINELEQMVREEVQKSLNEQEASPVVAKKKKNIFKLKPSVKLHKRAMNSLVKQKALNLSTMKLDPKEVKKQAVNRKCGYFGPIIDLTATAEKNKEGGALFSGETDTDKLFRKVMRFDPKKENRVVPEGLVMFDRDAFSKNFKYDPEAFATNFGARGGFTLEDIAKDVGGVNVLGKAVKTCPSDHKCVRKCYQGRDIKVDKITTDMVKFTAEPIITKDQVTGRIKSIGYAPGTKYATLDFQEFLDPDPKSKGPAYAKAFQGAADFVRSEFGKVAFVGVYAPGGKVVKSSANKDYETTAQIYVADGWQGGNPIGNTYPAVINQVNGNIVFVPLKDESFTW